MSTLKDWFSRQIVVCVLILLCVSIFRSQDLEVKVKILPQEPASLRVEGKFLREDFPRAGKNWSFAQSAPRAEGLGARISNLTLIDRRNKSVSLKKLAPGEYLAEMPANVWSYTVDTDASSKNISPSAHISWLKDEQGILMLSDLLPQFDAGNSRAVSARIDFVLPAGWEIISRERKTGDYSFEVDTIETAVFVVGKNWRQSEIRNGVNSLNIAIAGEWQFVDKDVSQMAESIFGAYRELFGECPSKTSLISLVRMPKGTKFGRWEAETRGASLMIVSADMPFKTLSMQRLHEQLRHELFHLWIPNNLALTGNYDWFYEGFAVYQALRTGVETNQIRFEDFLDTLAEAYNFDNQQNPKVPLTEASKNRWSSSSNGSLVYARGMIVAFLCDIALLKGSKGKNSASAILRGIYQKYRLPNKAEDGNRAMLNELEFYAELRPLVAKYIRGAEKINWESDLESAGIKATETNFGIKLIVEANSKGRRKELLNRLGYNNWRKISEK